jgi:hypothetical protein
MTADALLEQLARDIRAWERAEAIEVVQVWLNGWGYWVAEWRILAKKRGPDQYDYFSASGSAIPFGHLLDDIVEAGKAHGHSVTHVAQPASRDRLLLWYTDPLGRKLHSKLNLKNMED